MRPSQKRRVLILALGSRGDVQPCVTLGKALIQAGHQVRMATFRLFAGMVQDAGLEFLPISGDAEGLLRLAGSQGGLNSGSSLIHKIAALQRSYGSLARSFPSDFSVSKIRDTDLVLNQLPCNLFGWDIAEYLRIPHALVSVIPLARTRYRPLFGFPKLPIFFPSYNLLTYRLGEQIGWQMFRAAVNGWRARVGLPEQSWLGMFERMQKEKTPIINGFSGQVIERPLDWGEHISMTGWWMPEDLRPSAAPWSPPPELVRFIEAGTPPVFVGFGSMVSFDSEKTTEIVVEAARAAGQRLLLHAGWAGLGSHLSPDVYNCGEIPYHWLFSRVAAVIHHGGSGTTGYALHSGTPSMVVPFLFDQGEWGRRSSEAGVGPPPLPFRQLTTARLAERIADAVENLAYRQKAAALKEKLQNEKGVLRAVEIIERGLM